MDTDNINNELSKLLQLIKIEQKEELEEFRYKFVETPLNERKEQGITWYPVNINSVDTGFNQKIVVEFEKTNFKDKNHFFQNGKSVAVFVNTDNKNTQDYITGTVLNVKGEKIKIAFNITELPEWFEEGKIGIDLYYDEKTFKEMEFALNYVINTEDKRLNYLKDVLYGKRKALFNKENLPINYSDLNYSQNHAVRKVNSAEDIAVIHGPPGTGKTTTLVKAIENTLTKEKQVLVVAPSNTAVDLLTRLLATKGLNVVRIGNPARVNPENLKNTFDAKTENHMLYNELKKMYKEADNLRSQAFKFKRNFGSAQRENRKALIAESKALLSDARRIEKIISQDVLDNAQVICCTFVGCAEENLRSRSFSTLFIDEAGQSLEPACWIAIKKAEKVILAGDHKQLPPTIKSDLAMKKGLGITLFEKLIDKQNESSVLLDIQYRMNEKIMNFSNAEFYDSKLKADESVKNYLLFPEDKPVLFIDTAGCGFNETVNQKTLSYYNTDEINVLINHLNSYLPQLTQNVSIGIISPYKEQVIEIKKAIDKSNYPQASIAIDTVDGFQGQEKDIIYISLVRSNDSGEIGFLKDIRRMNVAMTRAKKKLVIIGDSATISENKFYSDLITYVESIDAYDSAWSFM